MNESKPLFREPGRPLVVDAGSMQLVSYGVPMVAAKADVSELAGKPTGVAETIIGNCTTTIPLKLDLHEGDVGNSFVFGPTGKGMSVLPELLQDEYQKRGGKPVVFDKGTSLSGLMNQDKEEA